MRVQHWLDNNHTTPYTLTDRRVFVYDPTHVLIVEVDEDQQKSNSLCHETRIINIAHSLKRKTIFIRYNPDDFSCEGRKYCGLHTRRGCWYYVIGSVSKLENLDYVAHLVLCVYLFFDGFDEKKGSVCSTSSSKPGFIRKTVEFRFYACEGM